MDPEQDTEITLGTAKLLSLFFGLVIVCAVFFALGYTLGRKSDVGLTAPSPTPLPNTLNNGKPGGSAAPQQMSFYKAVEQKDANPQLSPASPDASSPTAQAPAAATASPSGTQAQTGNPPDPLAALPTSGYVVQVAAVTKQEDADALVDALKKKEYPAFVATNSTSEKLFRIQVGPFAEIKDAEAMRTRLVNDGYNPIVKK
jgi:DedD protein